jgi:hypothetical protein
MPQFWQPFEIRGSTTREIDENTGASQLPWAQRPEYI